MMKRLLLILFVSLFLFPAFSQEEEGFNWNMPMLGKKAPDLKVKDWITEKPDMKGKFIVLDFWATFCGPCVKFTPHMNEFANRFKKDAVFIAVATESVAKVERGILEIKKRKKKLNEKYTPIKFYQATDPDYELFNQFHGEGIPMVIIIDKNGIVRWQGNPHGDGGENMLTSDVIENIIEKYR